MLRKHLAIGFASFFVCFGVANAATSDCGSVAACVFGINNDSGDGVEGTSKLGDGVVGITAQNTTAARYGKAGVAGYDNSTNKEPYNSGVFGTSTYGYGVQGKTTVGTAVYGTATSGTGVFASAPSGMAIHATTTVGTGIYATATTGTGVAAVTTGGQAVVGNSNATYANQSAGGVAGYSSNGDGVVGFQSTTLNEQEYNPSFGPAGVSGQGYVGVTGVGGGTGSSGNSPGAGVVGEGNGGVAMIAYSDGNFDAFQAYSQDNPIMSLDKSGNMVLAGTIITNGTPQVRTKNVSGAEVVAYNSREAIPTIEDFGRATLRDGSAEIVLNAGFASILNQRQPYMVFITAEGDSRGLFATRLTPSSFAVRENGGGRSSLMFSYRIVGYPADVANVRFRASSTMPHLPNPTKFRLKKISKNVVQ